jgi:ketosteroid isomerase-like protein
MSGSLIDTNVLSEFNRRGEPDERVKQWLVATPLESLYVSVVAIAEIQLGIELQAFNRHDSDALAALLTEDTVFEDTSPASDGSRIEGTSAVLEFWRAWFARNADAQFEAEDVIVSGDRAVVRWVYRKTRNGRPWHLRGVDVFTVHNGKVAAKLAYVKG